ncbi:MAG: DUF2617 family protein [Pirellulaceae bacterium]
MNISTVRPKVAELTFQLLGRSVHPELFQIHKSHTIERENYSARIHITADGHIITWKSGRTVLTEVAASVHQLLPGSGRCLAVPLRHTNQDRIEYNELVSYRYEFALERVQAEMFWLIQQQLGEASKNHELIQVFDSSGRIGIGGLSFIHIDTRLKSLHVQAIHTFPDDMALVKTESTFSVK